MDSDENRMEFFYYEACEFGVAITHNQTIIAMESYYDPSDTPSGLACDRSEYHCEYEFDFVNSDEIDWWIN